MGMIELPFDPKRFRIDKLRKRKFEHNKRPEEQFTQEQLMRIQNAAHFTKQVFPSNSLREDPSMDVRSMNDDELGAWQRLQEEARKSK